MFKKIVLLFVACAAPLYARQPPMLQLNIDGEMDVEASVRLILRTHSLTGGPQTSERVKESRECIYAIL
jgi:hypothetical protein